MLGRRSVGDAVVERDVALPVGDGEGLRADADGAVDIVDDEGVVAGAAGEDGEFEQPGDVLDNRTGGPEIAVILDLQGFGLVAGEGRRSVAGADLADDELVAEEADVAVEGLDQRVGAAFVEEQVEPVAAGQVVVADAAVDHVPIGRADDDVRAGLAAKFQCDPVFRHAGGVDVVVAAAELDLQEITVGADRLDDQHLDRAARSEPVGGNVHHGTAIDGRGALGPGVDIDGIAAARADDAHDVGATADGQTDVDDQRVDAGGVQRLDIDLVGAGAQLEQQHLDRGAFDAGAPALGLGAHRVGGRPEHPQPIRVVGADQPDDVAAAAAVDDLDALVRQLADDQIIAAVTEDRVRAAAAGDLVIPAAAMDDIRGRAAGDEVTVVAAKDCRRTRTVMDDHVVAGAAMNRGGRRRGTGLEHIEARVAEHLHMAAAAEIDDVVAATAVELDRCQHALADGELVDASSGVSDEDLLDAGEGLGPAAEEHRHRLARGGARVAGNVLDLEGLVGLALGDTAAGRPVAHVEIEVAAAVQTRRIPAGRIAQGSGEMQWLRQFDIANGELYIDRDLDEHNFHRGAGRNLDRHAP